MTYCPQCGSENEPSARFCLKCGQELALKTEARGVWEGRGKVRVVLLVLLGFVGLALAGVCAVGGVALFQRYEEEMKVRHYTQGIQGIEGKQWDVAVAELQQAGNYLDAEEELEYAEEQLGKLLVLYDGGMTYFDAREYWDAAWWLGQAADVHPDYEDANESLEYARQQIGKILYVGKDSPGQHLHIMDADGRSQREHLSVGPEEGDLRVAGMRNDATRALVQTDRYDGTRSYVDLYGLDLVSESATQFVSNANMAWGTISPDGDQVVFRAQQEPSSLHSLYLADFDGGNQRVIATATGFLLAFFASSDGERILVSRNDVDPYECVIYFTNPLSQTYKEVMRREGAICYAFLSWDMNHMIIREANREQERWALCAADASGLRMAEFMSDDTGYVSFGPRYSSDGDEFVFGVRLSSDMPTTYYLARADGSDVRALPLQTDEATPELSPMLEHALFASHDEGTGERRLYIAEANTGERTLLSSSAGELQKWRSFSPDGQKIVFPEKISEGQTAIYVTNLDGSERQLVAYGGRPVWLWPRQ